MRSAILALSALLGSVSAHYTFPALLVNGQSTGDWVNVRMTDNHYSNGPVTDVTSSNFRCYTDTTKATASTANVTSGSTIGFTVGGTSDGIYHAGVVNVYMAKVPSGQTAASWDGSGKSWFKVHQITATTDGGSTIKWPAQNVQSVSFALPKALPSGQYLVRMEAIALHSATGFQGAQFYLSCAQINVANGGSGTPGPLVAIPGVYTGTEPGIEINIYYPIPATYTQPGPAVWSG